MKKDNKLSKKMKNTLLIIVGTFLLACSVEYFILPFNILSGGVAGIAVILEPVLGMNKTLVANLIMIILFLLGGLSLGKDFMLKTALSSLLYPVFTTLLSFFPIPFQIDPILGSFYAGLLGGFGIGLVMRADASTGGMDIPPLILHKYTNIPIATLVMITDAITILLGIITYDITAALIGLVSVFASGVALKKAFELDGNDAKSVQIISEHYETILERIFTELDRSATVYDATGAYSNENRKVVLCVVSQRQYVSLLEIIRETDDHAFVITTDVSDMHGEGFTYTSPNI